MTFIYLEMPKFTKKLEELESHFEKWLFILKNLQDLERIHLSMQGKIFAKLFDTAEIAGFTPEQVLAYEDSLKYYRDMKNSFDTARSEGWMEGLSKGRKEGLKEGREEGREEGRKEGIELTARNALKMGLSVADTAKLTGLTPEQIEKLG